MIEALHHVQLAMPPASEDAARAFYADILGFEEVEKPEVLKGRGGVWFIRGSVQLHLSVEDPFVPARKAHPAFRVTSLDQMIRHLDAREVSYRRDIDLPNMRRVYVDDPFGNRIELVELV